MEHGPTIIGTQNPKSISLRADQPKKSIPVTIASGQGVLAVGSLMCISRLNSFVGDVGVGGIDDAVAIIPLANDSGTLVDGSTIRIGDELITVGTYDAVGDQLTGCTRGVRGTTAAAHSANAPITVIDTGATAEKYRLYDGLDPIEGYLNEEIDATSEDVSTYIIYDDVVDKNQLIAKTGVPIPEGRDRNSSLLIKEAN